MALLTKGFLAIAVYIHMYQNCLAATFDDFYTSSAESSQETVQNDESIKISVAELYNGE